jgi:hypothetical protein
MLHFRAGTKEARWPWRWNPNLSSRSTTCRRCCCCWCCKNTLTTRAGCIIEARARFPIDALCRDQFVSSCSTRLLVTVKPGRMPVFCYGTQNSAENALSGSWNTIRYRTEKVEITKVARRAITQDALAIWRWIMWSQQKTQFPFRPCNFPDPPLPYNTCCRQMLAPQRFVRVTTPTDMQGVVLYIQ